MANKTGRPTRALQENVVTLLCHSDKHGRLVAAIVDPNLFEGDYQTFALAAVDYWHRHNKAPRHHTADLVAEVLDAGGPKAKVFEDILRSMVELSDGINSEYVLDQLRQFVRVQKVKQAIMASAEKINASAEMAVEEVEGIWNELLKVRQDHFDRGLSLGEYERVLDYIQSKTAEFPLGIPQLDKARIGPARGESLLLLGATGAGKSWFLIQACIQALNARKKVLHITGEMGQEQVAMRYYQSMFNAAKRERTTDVTEFELNSLDKIDKIYKVPATAEFTFDSDNAHDELQVRLNTVGTRINNLIIKEFSSLNMDKIEAYLDSLEVTENWVPDLVALDYWGLMQHSEREHRLGLGHAYIRWRSMLKARKMAGVTAQQSSKAGAEATTVKATNVAEDWSLIHTSDVVLTYSATSTEKSYGLARVYVDKARDEKDKWGVLITQNYNAGQFCLQSIYLGQDYWLLMPKLRKEIDGEEDDIEKEKENDRDERPARRRD